MHIKIKYIVALVILTITSYVLYDKGHYDNVKTVCVVILGFTVGWSAWQIRKNVDIKNTLIKRMSDYSSWVFLLVVFIFLPMKMNESRNQCLLFANTQLVSGKVVDIFMKGKARKRSIEYCYFVGGKEYCNNAYDPDNLYSMSDTIDIVVSSARFDVSSPRKFLPSKRVNTHLRS